MTKDFKLNDYGEVDEFRNIKSDEIFGCLYDELTDKEKKILNRYISDLHQPIFGSIKNAELLLDPKLYFNM